MKKALAFIHLINGFAALLSLYFAFTSKLPHQALLNLFFAGLNAYLFISDFENIKALFITKESK